MAVPLEVFLPRWFLLALSVSLAVVLVRCAVWEGGLVRLVRIDFLVRMRAFCELGRGDISFVCPGSLGVSFLFRNVSRSPYRRHRQVLVWVWRCSLCLWCSFPACMVLRPPAAGWHALLVPPPC